MAFFYLISIFFIFCFLSNKILNFINKQFFLSNLTLSIIISLVATKIIDHKFSTPRENRIFSPELIVGISPDYPPYAFIKDNTIVGFDIDLLTLIAEKLNLKLVLQPMPFHSILVSLQLDSITMAASGLTGNEERKKQMLITLPYFENHLCAVSLKENSFNTIDSLQNKTIIINTGYTSEDYIIKKNLTNNILKLKSVPDALVALNLKQGDVFITSYASIIQFLQTTDSDKFFIYNLPESDNEESVSFLINKKHPELLSKINVIIKEFINDKTIDNLIKKWNLV